MRKVPVLTPLQNVNYSQVGRFVSHSYMLTGFFPICFSRVFAKALTCDEECITDDELVTSFLNFTDSFEADAVRQCTSGSISSEVDCRFQNTVVPLLSRFNCNTDLRCEISST